MSDRAVYANANALYLPLGDKSVHMIATSPPYWGLRSYDTGDNKAAELGAEPIHDCGAWLRRPVIGYKSTPEFEEDGDGNMIIVGTMPEPIYGKPEPPCGGCYVCNMRTWAREMWRVLADTGVMFLNLGDSYYNYRPGGTAQTKQTLAKHSGAVVESSYKRGAAIPGLKEKDLVGIPWRVALALQADGWYLRSDIIWAKPNPMPESVTDRPTKAHEYVFLLTKSARYFWDAEAVREEYAMTSWTAESDKAGTTKRGKDGIRSGEKGNARANGAADGTRYGETSFLNNYQQSGRNLRTVWTIATAPYSGAHYATWPPALVERMVKAGTSERGVCPECGRPWERITERGLTAHDGDTATTYANGSTANRLALLRQAARERGGEYVNERKTVGWRPTCAHTDATPVPAIVLDPFAGSGTTLLVARQLGRIGLGFDLSEKYLYENARTRLGHDKLAAWGNGIKDTADHNDMPLFAGVTL